MSQQVWGESAKERCELLGLKFLQSILLSLCILQLTRHTCTVCTHQVRNCDFKDLGCQYKVCMFIIYHLRVHR